MLDFIPKFEESNKFLIEMIFHRFQWFYLEK